MPQLNLFYRKVSIYINLIISKVLILCVIDTVYFLQLDAINVYSWFAASIIDMAKVHKASLKDMVLVHLTDNQRNNHLPIYETFYKEWKYVLRNYWWNDPLFYPMVRSNFLTYFPLGYSSHMHTASQEKIMHPKDRQHVLNFLGNSQSGNFKRAGHLREFTAKTGYNVTGQVQKSSFGFGSTTLYRDLMLNSKFCITIVGRFVECYRMYDALEVGCIVVMIDQYDNFNYIERYSEQLHPILTFPWTDSRGNRVTLRNPDGTLRLDSYLPYNTGGYSHINIMPFIYMHTVDDFNIVLKYLLQTPDEMLRIQRESTVWWQQMKSYYKNILTEKLCIA